MSVSSSAMAPPKECPICFKALVRRHDVQKVECNMSSDGGMTSKVVRGRAEQVKARDEGTTEIPTSDEKRKRKRRAANVEIERRERTRED
jgi:hypothetical protein